MRHSLIVNCTHSDNIDYFKIRFDDVVVVVAAAAIDVVLDEEEEEEDRVFRDRK